LKPGFGEEGLNGKPIGRLGGGGIGAAKGTVQEGEGGLPGKPGYPAGKQRGKKKKTGSHPSIRTGQLKATRGRTGGRAVTKKKKNHAGMLRHAEREGRDKVIIVQDDVSFGMKEKH